MSTRTHAPVGSTAVPPLSFASVQRGLLQRKCACGGSGGKDGECEECKKKRGASLQRCAANASEPTSVPPMVHEVLRSPGRPLDAGTRAFFEPRFGHNFGKVRIHTDAQAAESARSVNALAYTVGREIAFGPDQYAPQTAAGRRLLAHELTHVVQQRGASTAGLAADELEVGASKTPLEQEADSVALGTLNPTSNTPNGIPGRAQGPTLQRACPPVPTGLGASPSSEPCTHAGNALIAGKNLLFCQDSDELTGGQTSWLASIASDAKTATKIELHGNASIEGPKADPEYNFTLACKRATAIAHYLTAAGVSVPIAVFTHGPTSLYGAPESNRNVVVVLTAAAAATAPTPAATPPATSAPAGTSPVPPPQFVCGPDVTKQVSDAVGKTRTTFAGWSADDRESACDSLTSLLTGSYAWDINELHNNAWILTFRPTCASEKATPPCGSSVQVGGSCYYAGSVNYVIFGTMCDLCDKHLTATGSSKAADFKLGGMLKLVDEYKGTGFTGHSTPSANFGPSKDWATAGFLGWLSGASAPAGDRPDCKPVCPSPYTGPPFKVHWVPEGWF